MPLNRRWYVIASWIGIGAIALVAVYTMIQGQWFAMLQLLVFLAASVAFVAFEDRLPSLFDLLFVAAAVVNAAGWIWGLYEKVWGYDEIAHFFTSFTVTLSVGFLVYYALRDRFREHAAHFVLVIASFGISLGACWEVVEWMFMSRLPNPVVDIIADGLGAILAGFAAAWALGAESPNGASPSRDEKPFGRT